MNEKIVHLHAQRRNIERYEGLLKSNLSEIESRFVEQRLSEERLALAMLQFMSPGNSAKEDDFLAHGNSAEPKLRSLLYCCLKRRALFNGSSPDRDRNVTLRGSERTQRSRLRRESPAR